MIDVDDPWASVVGQPEAVATLRAWSVDPVHAYLFVGPSGTGKRQASRVFAGMIQSQLSPGEAEAGKMPLWRPLGHP